MKIKVQVMISQLAIDIGGEVKKFRKSEVFDCPEDRLERLGTSVKIVKNVSPVIIPEDGEDMEKTETTGKKRR